MNKFFALLAAIVMFMGTYCHASTAKQYPELACTNGVMKTHFVGGDTLSEFAMHYKPHGMKLKDAMATLAGVQKNEITNVDRIYAGHVVYMPWCTCKHATATPTASTEPQQKTAMIVARATSSVPGTPNFMKPERTEESTYQFVIDAQFAPVPDQGPLMIAARNFTPPAADSTPAPAVATAIPPVMRVSSNEGTSVQSLAKGWYRIPVYSSELPTGMFHPAVYVDHYTGTDWKTRKDIDRFYIRKKADGTESILMQFPERVTNDSGISLIVEDNQGNPHRFWLSGQDLLNRAESIPAPDFKETHFTDDKYYQADKQLLYKYCPKAPRNIGRTIKTYVSLAVANTALMNPFTAPAAVVRDVQFVRSTASNHRAAKQQKQALLASQKSSSSGGNNE